MKAMNRRVLIGLLTLLGLLNLSRVAVGQKDVGYLKVDANPGRAGVFVDDKYLGPAANFRVDRKYALSPGQHTVRFSEPRYKDHTTTINIEAGKTTKLTSVMEKLPVPQPPYGMLHVVKGPHSKFSAVFINGQFMGHVGEYDNSLQGELIKPGEYEVKIVSPEGKVIHEEKISIKADQTTTVRLPS
jgi:PEGA domain